MKKLVPVLFVLILILSSCYYPADEDISQDPVVATNVAQILTREHSIVPKKMTKQSQRLLRKNFPTL